VAKCCIGEMKTIKVWSETIQELDKLQTWHKLPKHIIAFSEEVTEAHKN